jgi:hypothetical protein
MYFDHIDDFDFLRLRRYLRIEMHGIDFFARLAGNSQERTVGGDP